MLRPKPQPEKSLADQIKEAQAAADAFLDAKAAELHERFPGLPAAMLRRDIEAKAWGCPCKQALSVLETAK
jgi:hypothetical protein